MSDMITPQVSTPKRIQRKRTKGWKLPPNTVVVSRPSKWGNPFKVGEWIERDCPLAQYLFIPGGWHGLAKVRLIDAKQAVEAYASWLMEYPPLMVSLPELRGKNLVCWCRIDQPCHADVLLEWANE